MTTNSKPAQAPTPREPRVPEPKTTHLERVEFRDFYADIAFCEYDGLSSTYSIELKYDSMQDEEESWIGTFGLQELRWVHYVIEDSLRVIRDHQNQLGEPSFEELIASMKTKGTSTED